VASRCGDRVKVTGVPAALASSLLVPRGGNSSRPGLVLALLALLAQIAGPGLHPPTAIGSVNGADKLALALGAHALCLAPNSATPGQPVPADKAPDDHHDLAACCVWHGVASAVLGRAALVEPLTFVSIRVAFASPPADIPARKPGNTRARAPPIGAKHLAI
jgi:hypothetical protein